MILKCDSHKFEKTTVESLCNHSCDLNFTFETEEEGYWNVAGNLVINLNHNENQGGVSELLGGEGTGKKKGETTKKKKKKK